MTFIQSAPVAPVHQDYFNDKANQTYLVVGQDTDSAPVKQALVGVATSFSEASNIVGKDYLEILKAMSLNPIEYSLSSVSGTDLNSGYRMKGYSWTFVPVQFNSLLNLAL
jgi:hypothetical protein